MAKPKTMKKWDFYAPDALFDRIDKWAVSVGITARADAVRTLLRAALDAADNRLTADDLAELEGLRQDFGKASVRDAIRAARRTAAALERSVDDGAPPVLRVVASEPAEPAPAPPAIGFLSRAVRAIAGG